MEAKLVAGSTYGKGRGNAKARALRQAASRLSGGRTGIALIGMTDAKRLSDPLKALDALPAGCALIWRAYGAGTDAGEFQRLAARARAINCLLLIAGDPKRARRLGAGGLHLPERLLGRIHGSRAGATTAAAHSEAAIHRAARAGAMVTIAEAEALRGRRFDLVLLDVPCSGTGTWRRTPDAKWTLTPERLADLLRVQAGILDAARGYVAPGGHLAYMTCSLLAAENRAQIDAFVARNPSWRLIRDRLYTPLDGGDGFYSALLTRA